MKAINEILTKDYFAAFSAGMIFQGHRMKKKHLKTKWFYNGELLRSIVSTDCSCDTGSDHSININMFDYLNQEKK